MAQSNKQLVAASQRASSSLQSARQLLSHGHPSAALVWAVRAVEIFLKEFVLADIYMQRDDSVTWEQAVRKASARFEKVKWRRALAEVDKEFGPLDPIKTADGRDVLIVWEKEIVPRRHNVVHGREEASALDAAMVVEWAAEIIKKLKLRLIVAGRHSLSEEFQKMYSEAFEAYHGRRPLG